MTLSIDNDTTIGSDRGARSRAPLAVVAMLVTTLIGSVLPLIRTPNFYFWDDTAGVAVGVWQRIAQSVLAGQLPFLEPDMWRGGNFAAEAATGMWNPVMLFLMVVTHPIDDVAVAITLAKICLFLITAGGIYLLARSYGAPEWTAAVAGTALALSGWAIFMDGSSWINGTAITAFTPWAWWALRRTMLLEYRPWSVAVAAFFAYLVPSTGNPYGVLSLAVVFLALAIEAVVTGRARRIVPLVAIGAGVLLLVIVVYLPFVFTSAYGNRANSGIWNDEFLSVSLSNLLGMSMPTHRPYIMMWGNPMGFPGTYLAWFILPLVPWIRWRSVDWRALVGVIVFGGLFLVMALGPSQLGMFRWPARLVPFVYIAVIVVFAVAAGKGLIRSRPGVRWAATAGLIFAGTWMAFSDTPSAWKWHALTTIAIVVGVFLAVRWAGTTSWRAFAVLGVGAMLALVPQLALTKSNQNVADYEMPSSKSALQQQFAARSDGMVVQIFDVQKLVAEHPASDRWDDLLAGNMPSVAGFESTTAYSGIGFTDFDAALCMSYNGGTCAAAWDALWEQPKGADAPLADLLRARYVVVLNDYADNDEAPSGWTEVDRTDVVTVYERDSAIPFPNGTISSTGADVSVSADEKTGVTAESVTVSTTGGPSGDRTLTFARIAWPGYTVSVDGKSIAATSGPAGLLTVELPPGLDDAELTMRFTPPGLVAGLVAGAAGVIVLGGTIWACARRRRAESHDTDGTIDQPV